MSKALDNKIILKEKLYVALCTSVQFFNILDFVVLLPLGPLLMAYYNIGPKEFAVLASSYNVSAGLMGILYSSFADNFDRKKFLIFTLVMFSITTLACGFAPSYNILLSARILAGIFGGMLTPTCYSIISELIPFERRGKAMGTIMASFSLTSIIGIPIGLAIADEYGHKYTFYFITIGAVIALIFCFKLLPNILPTKKAASISSDLKRMLKIAIKKDYIIPYITIILFTFSGFMIFPFLTPYAVQNIGIGQEDIKYIYLVGGIFTAFGSKYVGKLTDVYGTFPVFLPNLIISLPFVYLYTSVENISLLTLLLISTPFMVFINTRFVPIMTLLTAQAKKEEAGSFMGVLLSYRSFAGALGTFFAGLVIKESENKLVHFDWIGYISIILAIIGATLVYYIYNKQRDKRCQN